MVDNHPLAYSAEQRFLDHRNEYTLTYIYRELIPYAHGLQRLEVKCDWDVHRAMPHKCRTRNGDTTVVTLS